MFLENSNFRNKDYMRESHEIKERILKEEKEKIKIIENLENPSEKLKECLKLLNNYVFPVSPIDIEIKELDIESKYGDKLVPAYHFFEKDKDDKMIDEKFIVNKKLDQNKDNYNFEHVLKVAIHEIRHRVQHTFPIGLFDKKNIEDHIKDYKKEFNLLISYFPKNISSNDFDACLIEEISAGLFKKGISLFEISEMISKDQESILKYLSQEGFLDKK